jgi:hypothetical protein
LNKLSGKERRVSQQRLAIRPRKVERKKRTIAKMKDDDEKKRAKLKQQQKKASSGEYFPCFKLHDFSTQTHSFSLVLDFKLIAIAIFFWIFSPKK